MVKESTITKLKWAGISAIMSFIVTLVFTSFLNYFYHSILTINNSTISLYIIPIIFGIAGFVLLISYYILSRKYRDNEDKWKYFPANTTDWFLFFTVTTEYNRNQFWYKIYKIVNGGYRNGCALTGHSLDKALVRETGFDSRTGGGWEVIASGIPGNQLIVDVSAYCFDKPPLPPWQSTFLW